MVQFKFAYFFVGNNSSQKVLCSIGNYVFQNQGPVEDKARIWLLVNEDCRPCKYSTLKKRKVGSMVTPKCSETAGCTSAFT